MNTGNPDPAALFDAEVVDSAGNNVGKVDGVWVDDATNELEFVGVKTGLILGKTHLIPVRDAEVGTDTITVPYTEDQVKGAPSFGTDDELSPESEDEIYGYYGLDRSTSTSPSGLPTGGTTDTGYVGDATGRSATNYDTLEDDRGGSDRDSVTLHEEELQVGKREVEAGRVRIRKVVRTEHREVPVELRREEIEIERVPATGGDTGGAFQEQEIDIPVMREEAVVEKESHATEQVRLNKTVDTETDTVGGDVRREDVEIDRNDETDTTLGTGDRPGRR